MDVHHMILIQLLPIVSHILLWIKLNIRIKVM